MNGVNGGDGPQHIDKIRARGASTTGAMRYVLGISLVLVVVAFAVIFFVV